SRQERPDRDTVYPRRRGGDRLPGRLPDAGADLRRPQRPQQPGPQAARDPAALPPAGRAGHPPAGRLPGPAAQPQPRAGGRPIMSTDLPLSQGDPPGEGAPAEPPAHPPSAARNEEQIIGPGHTFGSITDKISSIVLTQRTPKKW